jgi:predicted amidophosphoribosyltransferase
MSSALRRPIGWLAAVADLIWPLTCAGCGAPGVRWCASCSPLLAGPGRRTAPSPCPSSLPPVWTVAAYDGAVRHAIVSWKDEGRHDLDGPLGAGLATAVLAGATALLGPSTGSEGPALWLVPMPSRPAARRARGGEPVRDLAARAAARARRAGWPVQVLPVLEHLRAVQDQSGLDARQRRDNVAGAFGVRRGAVARLAATPCLLVDDVVTTGATLAEAAAAIRRAGGHPIGAAVVAATGRTGGVRVT